MVTASGTQMAAAILSWCLEEVGAVRLRVTGRCMAPALKEGQTVWIAPPGRGRPRWGDVVLVRRPEGVRLHRLLWNRPRRPTGRAWITKADTAWAWDGRLRPSDVLGVAISVETGGLEQPISRPPALRLLIGLLGAAPIAVWRRMAPRGAL
jgi:hypothetical protein